MAFFQIIFYLFKFLYRFTIIRYLLWFVIIFFLRLNFNFNFFLFTSISLFLIPNYRFLLILIIDHLFIWLFYHLLAWKLIFVDYLFILGKEIGIRHNYFICTFFKTLFINMFSSFKNLIIWIITCFFEKLVFLWVLWIIDSFSQVI